MSREYKLEDFTQDSFLHGTIEKFLYDPNKKYFYVVLSYMNLISGGCLYQCALTITGWWDLEVYEYNKQQKVKKFELDEVPEIDRIIKLSYDKDELILTDFGFHKDTAIDYKFTKPKIQITGQYDPD